VVTLAFPLLAGPGAITSAKLSFQTTGLAVTMLSIAIANVVTYDVIYLAATVYRVLGRRGSLIITRAFAVLVAAIAVQYLADGLKITCSTNCHYVV
jgi:multiple antibiotic resistance protein